MKLSSLKLNIVLIFQEGTLKSGNKKKQKKKKNHPEEIFNISPKKVLPTFRVADCYKIKKVKIFILQDDYFL